MKYIIFSFVLFSYLALFIGIGYSGPRPFPVLPPAYYRLDDAQERKAILKVIEQESAAFWDKDFAAYAGCWAQQDYVRTHGWWADGGITVVKGWEERARRTRSYMEEFPEVNSQHVRRENISIRVYQDAAMVTFDQYGTDIGESLLDMPGLSHETRFLEKQDGQCKIVYLGRLQQEKN
jgi:hypothetical protein